MLKFRLTHETVQAVLKLLVFFFKAHNIELHLLANANGLQHLRLKALMNNFSHLIGQKVIAVDVDI